MRLFIPLDDKIPPGILRGGAQTLSMSLSNIINRCLN